MTSQGDQWLDVGSAPLPEGELRYVETEAGPVLLVGGPVGVTAFQGLCPHQEYELSDAEMVDGAIECSGHGSRFDPESGDVVLDPARVGLAKYEMRERDGRLMLSVPAEGLEVRG